jgi:hypothetical protein
MSNKLARTIGLVLVAVFAMSAIATASASASLPELVNREGREVVKKKFTGKATGSSTFETKSGEAVKCTGGTTKGEVTGVKTQTVENKFTSCSAAAGLLKCKTKGAASGEIALKLNAKIVYISESAKTVGVDLVLPETITIECTGLLSETLHVKGSTICSTTTALSKKATITCRQTKGKQEFTEYEEAGRKIKDITETEGSGAKKFAFEESGLSSTNELEFEEEVEIKH